MTSEFNLNRFILAQTPKYDLVLNELRAGFKESHWMWFIFPQHVGLGFSNASKFYGISGLPEARAYLDEPILGARLEECIELTMAHKSRSAFDIFDSPDDVKFHACLTLFRMVTPIPSIFDQALTQFFGSKNHDQTLEFISG